MSNLASKNILLIEDNKGDARLLREMLNEQDLHSTKLTHVESIADAEERLAVGGVDIILLDLGLPDVQGLDAVRRACAAAPHIPLVVLTGSDNESLGVQALHEGAQDFLVKGQLESRGLLRSLRYAIERKVMEEALLMQKERAETTLNCIGDAIICTDVPGNITFLNVVAEKITGWSRQEATGQAMGDVFQILDAVSREATPNRMEIAVRENRTVFLPSNSILVRRDGSEIPIEDSASPIHDDKGQDAGAVIVFRDVSAARAMSQELNHSVQHDFLTGLPNRLLLNDRIGQAIALAFRRDSKVAVLFLDLDGFKHINDSLGHAIGDKLLQSIATRLVACVRESDTVSRQGGDEFVVLLSEVTRAEDAAVVARRIAQTVAGPHSIDQQDFHLDISAVAGRMLDAVAEPHSIDRHELHVTTSIGLSVYPDDGLDAETLIQNADTAMYQAKENGRQSYQFFKPEMNVHAVERQFIEESLRRAVERQEFLLHYQPVVDLATGAITGAEALIRWMHPVRGLIPPLQFIPVAEDCGLIVPIGAWVLNEACRQTRAWADAGLPAMTMAVNVSAIEFRNEAFLERVFATLRETGLDPGSLVVEITESVLMRHAESAASTLKILRESGIQVAIDDFGTGYSSLGYLRKFPLDALKIDQSFVRQISIPGEDTAILTAVIVMARGLNLRVIAEGVETPGELDFLRAHQCNEAQGYYLSRPVAPEQFEKLLGTGISEAEIVGRPRVSSAPVAPKVLNARSATLRTLSLVGSNNGNSPIAPQARAPGSHSRSTDKDG